MSLVSFRVMQLSLGDGSCAHLIPTASSFLPIIPSIQPLHP